MTGGGHQATPKRNFTSEVNSLINLLSGEQDLHGACGLL